MEWGEGPADPANLTRGSTKRVIAPKSRRTLVNPPSAWVRKGRIGGMRVLGIKTIIEIKPKN